MAFHFPGTSQLDAEKVTMDHSNNRRYCPSRQSGLGLGHQERRLLSLHMLSRCCSSCQQPPASYQLEIHEE